MARHGDQHTDKEFCVVSKNNTYAIHRIGELDNQTEIAVTTDITIAVRITELLNSYGEIGVGLLDK